MSREQLPDHSSGLLDPNRYSLDTEVGRLRHALAWTMAAYRQSLRGRPTPAVHVLAFGERVLKEAASDEELRNP